MLCVDREEFIKWSLEYYSIEYALNHMDEVLDQYLEVKDYENGRHSSSKQKNKKNS